MKYNVVIAPEKRKDKDGNLIKGKLKTLIGFELEDSIEDKCFLAVKVSGSYVPQNKVPGDVQSVLIGP